MSDNPRFCGKCGVSLTNAVKFCTNCGTEIIEVEKKQNITRIAKEEFLKKYHGKKILSHINYIIKANIGDKDRLNSINSLIDSKKELDDVNFQYLRDCSDEFNNKIKLKDEDTKLKQVIHTSEKKGTPAKKILGAIILIIFIAIVAAVASSSSDKPEEKSSYDIEREKEKEIARAVQDYKGKDGQGTTLVEVLGVVLTIAYGGENIVDNPTTEIGWYAFEDLTKRNDGKYGIYEVGFNLKTYREEVKYVWYYNTETEEIFPGDEGAKSILDTVDAFS